MDFKNLLRTMFIVAISATVMVSCDDNTSTGNDDNEQPHPYADQIRDNGVILPSSIDGDRTLSADSVYYVDGYVFVESGTLEIEAGTVIQAFEQPSAVADGNESSLIITREAKIDAEGTASDPIIFTSVLDDEPFGGQLTLNQTNSKLWAGVIILGKAPVYSEGATEVQIEGIPDGESRALFGGDDATHSSGTLKYVSIRFTGAEIGPGDEIQGLTLGGVGSGTTLEYIDIFVSADDGVEIFGGTVDIRYFSVAFAEDDSYDFDLGYQGTGQYLFALQGGNGADNGGEWDGGKPDNAPRYSTAKFANMTLVGLGSGSSERSADAPAILIRDGGAYSLYNSIITDFNGLGIEIEDLNEAEDTYDKIINDVNGDGATIAGNMWYTGNASSIETMVALTGEAEAWDPNGDEIVAKLTSWNNSFEDPALSGVSRTVGSEGLNPMPGADVTQNIATVPSGLDQVSYKGAFDPSGSNWLSGWTTLAKYGFLSN